MNSRKRQLQRAKEAAQQRNIIRTALCLLLKVPPEDKGWIITS